MSEEEILVDDEKKDVDPKEYERAKSELKNRCEKANLILREEEEPFKDGIKYLVLELPSGRDKRSYAIWDYANLEQILSIQFENFVFLNPYEAICSYENGTIEALVTTIDRIPTSFLRRRLLGRRGMGEDKTSELDLEVLSKDGEKKLNLSPVSKEIEILCSGARRSMLSLKLSGIRVGRHDDAVRILSRMADAFFFQMDLSFGVGLNLARVRQRYIYLSRMRAPEASLDDLVFPSQEYDEAPMSLYWYARSAQGMPLLQFLAYYQVIEFYFPTYFQVEARRKIRRIVKSPIFRADRDADIGRVLSALSSKGGSIGDERSMLRATLQECVDPGELRLFLSSDNRNLEFFSSKTKGLTTHKLPLANPTADLRNDAADRLYDIRCKIVHTKNDVREGEVELLLPFSKEAEQLYYDIGLIRYLARQVLITASSPLKFD